MRIKIVAILLAFVGLIYSNQDCSITKIEKKETAQNIKFTITYVRGFTATAMYNKSSKSYSAKGIFGKHNQSGEYAQETYRLFEETYNCKHGLK